MTNAELLAALLRDVTACARYRDVVKREIAALEAQLKELRK